MEESQIIVYGADWCPDCKRSREFLDQNNTSYKYISIESTPSAADEVTRLNNGLRRIPTIIFPDKTVLVEPTNQQLADKLSL